MHVALIVVLGLLGWIALGFVIGVPIGMFIAGPKERN